MAIWRLRIVSSGGESDVEVFAVDAWADEQDRDVGGGSLGGVDGAGPAVAGRRSPGSSLDKPVGSNN